MLSAENYSIDWWTIDGGGVTSTGGVYSATGTIGQPDAGSTAMTGGAFSVMGGFWALAVVQTPGVPLLSIASAVPGLATVSWTPSTGTNWVLQESLNLNSGAWVNAPSGWSNPVVVPANLPMKFYRLLKP